MHLCKLLLQYIDVDISIQHNGMEENPVIYSKRKLSKHSGCNPTLHLMQKNLEVPLHPFLAQRLCVPYLIQW